MKRTQFLDARRNIRKEFIAFTSIVLIGMLASLSYLGIVYSAATLDKDSLHFFNTYALWDLEIASTMLLDEEDLEAIRDLPGVERAEPVWQIDTNLKVGDKDSNVSVVSLPETISLPKLTEGRLPERVGECAVEQGLAEYCGLSVGQEISVDAKPLSGIDPLLQRTYTVTGIFQTPDHLTYVIPTTPYILVTADCFNREGLDGAFMKIRVRVEGTPYNRFDDAYREAVAPVKDAINAIASERAAARLERLRGTFDKNIDEGREKLAEAKEQLEDGWRQLEDGRRQLEEKRRELEDGRQQLEEARRQYEEAPAKLADARSRLDEGWQALADAKEQLDKAKEQLDQGGTALAEAEYQLAAVPGILYQYVSLLDRIEETTGPLPIHEIRDFIDSLPRDQLVELFPSLSFDDPEAIVSGLSDLYSMRNQFKSGVKTYGDGRMLWYYSGEQYLDALTLYDKNRKLLEQSEEDYADAQQRFLNGEQELLDGERQLRDAEAALRDAEAQLADGERQLRDGEEQYRQAERDLRDAETMRDQLQIGRWVVLNDDGNPGYIYAMENSRKLRSLSMTFSSIFLVVGALVIYATIGRMVEQQRNLIGATKAMGFYNREVFAKYLLFACAAAMLGVALGVLIAWLPVQRTMLNSYEELLNYGVGTRSFLLPETMLVVCGALLISVAAMYLGCSQLLKQPAIRLMQKAMPAGGRKKGGKSAEKSLYLRLIFRNMRMDWSRVLVTTVSIAGGCMLIVIGFTLLYGIVGITDRQFGSIQTYAAEVFYDGDENENAAAEIEAILDGNALPHVGVRKTDAVFEVNKTLNPVTLIIADDGALEGYFAIRGLDGEALAMPDSGMLVPRRFWEAYDYDVGDGVMLYDSGMNLNTVKIAGVFEHYYGQIFLLSPAAYEEGFLSAPEENCFFVRLDGMSLDTLREKLDGIEGLVNVRDASADRITIESMTSALYLVVGLMLFIAGLMDCFIVANFSLTYIQRKTAELTIMRVNGFSTGECIRYAAADLVVTTVFGTMFGLVLGGYVGRAILMTIETPNIQMLREPNIRSFLYAVFISIGFSAFSNSFALRRIRLLKLSDLT